MSAVAAACCSPTGSIAGARSPRGNRRPTACITASAGVFGAKVNSNASSVRGGKASDDPAYVARAIVDQRIHRHHVVEPARVPGSSMSPDAEFDRPMNRGRQECARAPRDDQRGRQVDRHHAGAAPRRLDRQRAGAATGVEQARAAHVQRQPRQQRVAHLVAAGAHGGADAARPARRRSAAPRPRPRCGRNRSRARRAVRGRWRWTSVEPQQIEDVAVLQRLARSTARSARPERRRPAACIRSAPPPVPAMASISNSVDFFSRLLRITSRSGKCASASGRPVR